MSRINPWSNVMYGFYSFIIIYLIIFSRFLGHVGSEMGFAEFFFEVCCFLPLFSMILVNWLLKSNREVSKREKYSHYMGEKRKIDFNSPEMIGKVDFERISIMIKIMLSITIAIMITSVGYWFLFYSTIDFDVDVSTTEEKIILEFDYLKKHASSGEIAGNVIIIIEDSNGTILYDSGILVNFDGNLSYYEITWTQLDPEPPSGQSYQLMLKCTFHHGINGDEGTYHYQTIFHRP